MSVVADILQSYRHPRVVIDRHLRAGVREDRAFVFLVIACGIIFVAQWPVLARASYLDPSQPLDMRLGGALLGWMFIAPLGLYAIAFLLHGLMRLLRGTGTSYQSRLVLFWSFLAVAPVWLCYGLVAGFIGAGQQLNIIGILLLAAFFWIFINGMIEAYWPHKEP